MMQCFMFLGIGTMTNVMHQDDLLAFAIVSRAMKLVQELPCIRSGETYDQPYW